MYTCIRRWVGKKPTLHTLHKIGFSMDAHLHNNLNLKWCGQINLEDCPSFYLLFSDADDGVSDFNGSHLPDILWTSWWPNQAGWSCAGDQCTPSPMSPMSISSEIVTPLNPWAVFICNFSNAFLAAFENFEINISQIRVFLRSYMYPGVQIIFG